jgi:circadian clock protein KaiB
VDANDRFELLITPKAPVHYMLKLFVAGMSPRSTAAVATVKAICEEHLAGRYDLEVVDLYRAPERAAQEQVIAAPTLLKSSPLPERRLVGNLSDLPRVLRGLSLATT